jgi:hypothetical protein
MLSYVLYMYVICNGLCNCFLLIELTLFLLLITWQHLPQYWDVEHLATVGAMKPLNHYKCEHKLGLKTFRKLLIYEE